MDVTTVTNILDCKIFIFVSEIQSKYRYNRYRDIELSSSILIYWVKRGRSLQTFTQQK